jgi:hypothetical protein
MKAAMCLRTLSLGRLCAADTLGHARSFYCFMLRRMYGKPLKERSAQRTAQRSAVNTSGCALGPPKWLVVDAECS